MSRCRRPRAVPGPRSWWLQPGRTAAPDASSTMATARPDRPSSTPLSLADGLPNGIPTGVRPPEPESRFGRPTCQGRATYVQRTPVRAVPGSARAPLLVGLAAAGPAGDCQLPASMAWTDLEVLWRTISAWAARRPAADGGL